MKEITHGNTSCEVRKSKDGREYFHQSWQCTWNIERDLDTAQMRSLNFWKHSKFQETYTVVVSWLALTSFQRTKQGLPKAIPSLAKYRVNLHTGNVSKIYNKRLIKLYEVEPVPGAAIAWKSESLAQELRILTLYAEQMWKAFEAHNIRELV